MAIRLTSLNDLILRKEKIDGVWKLTPRHTLEYRRRGKREEVILSGEPIAVESHGLAFRVSEAFENGSRVSRIISLRGRWQADSQNRLTFFVERGNGKSDRLTLEGGWTVDHHEILYRFRKEEGKESGLLRFQGYWDLGSDKRLTYVLDQESDSAFRFRGAFQTPSLLAKKGEIRYQVGVEVEGKTKIQTITLFGQWKLSRDLALSFEVPYQDERVRAIRLKASYSIGPRNTLTAELLTRQGKPLGLELIFTREFLSSEGEAFARLRRTFEETAIEGGVRIRW